MSTKKENVSKAWQQTVKAGGKDSDLAMWDANFHLQQTSIYIMDLSSMYFSDHYYFYYYV